jgi:DNA modification methylase
MDQLLIFRKKGDNEIPISHEEGLTEYAGEIEVPNEIMKYRKHKGNQIENRYSHWIWRQYASSFWDDIRIDNVLPFKEARDEEDEKHVHPLQLDVIDRIIELRTNENEIVLTPFMGVGSEVYSAVLKNRKAIGVELKETYYNQSIKNLEEAEKKITQDKKDLFNVN